MVVAGDLRKAIGTPMELGKVLLEIAPLDRVMVELQIPEYEIGYVRPTDTVQLRVDSARVGTVDSNLKKIYPSAQIRDDESVFIAPIELDNLERMYRPGMKRTSDHLWSGSSMGLGTCTRFGREDHLAVGAII